MLGRRSTRLVTMYVLSLAATISLLVVWVVYMVRDGARLATSGAGSGAGTNWALLLIGCVLLFFVIVALTYQLAQALAARRYAQKQDEFVSNITHELKSPLSAIKLHAQTLQQELGDLAPETRRGFLVTIEEQADHMAALVDSVLESSRLVSKGRRLELRPVDMGAFMAAYVAGVAPQTERRGVHLRASLDSTARVLGTEEALRRVLDNLIDNAVRFSRPGGEVRCRVADERGIVRIEVEDDGVGIPKRDLPNVFDRFYRGGRGGGPHSYGTGLGLSIVAGLVEEMRGSVRAFSQEGRPGTRLVVELPALGATA